MFNVIRQYRDIDLNDYTLTTHGYYRMADRDVNGLLRDSLDDMGTYYHDSFVVDTGHPQGLEIHIILNNGILLIFNKDTHRFVTFLYYRVGQIQRYYNYDMSSINRDIMEMAFDNQYMGMNNL